MNFDLVLEKDYRTNHITFHTDFSLRLHMIIFWSGHDVSAPSESSTVPYQIYAIFKDLLG